MSTRYSTVSPLQPRVTAKASRTLQNRKINTDRAKERDISSLTRISPLAYETELTITQERPNLEQSATIKKTRNWLSSDLRAKDLMRTCEVALRPEDSIERAARIMSETEEASIPVVDAKGCLIGIITPRDITMRLIAAGASVPHTQVSDCMTAQVFACSADNSLESCLSAMCWHQLKRIPIVDDEHRMLGTISQRDLAEYLFEHTERVEPTEMIEVLWALAS